MKVRVSVEESIDDYDEEVSDKRSEDIKMDINEDYLNGVNQN